MLRSLGTRVVAGRVPGLKRVPILKVLAIGEVAMMARSHVLRLEPGERRRFVELLREGRGRPRNLSEEERAELSALVAKAEPRLFAGSVANWLSPVPLPKRLVRGRARR